MTVTHPQQRVDLFTHIHKALRKGLFDVGIRAGACDWTDAEEIHGLVEMWAPLVELLRSHTEHEDAFIFPLLEDPTVIPHDEHRDLDDLLADLDDRLEQLRTTADPGRGLDWYRDLMRYIAVTLGHLQFEETVVMPALWATRTDQELAECRATFLAATPVTVTATSMRLLRAAVEPALARALGR